MPYIVFALIFASYVNQTYRSLDDGLTINGVYSLLLSYQSAMSYVFKPTAKGFPYKRPRYYPSQDDLIAMNERLK